MWNPKNYLIKFIPNCEFTDPSYHLPHFYRLFSKFADERDREFWIKASEASRAYLKKACHPVTGLAPEYANYDGSPNSHNGHDKFFSDSYRVAANIGLDYEWFAAEEGECELAERIQTFFGKTVRGNENHIYEIDGTDTKEAILHPTGLLATNAMASLASKGDLKEAFVRRFWTEPLRTGKRRYYDNCLYIFAFLALSGRYRIWK
jgi:oligosaccharide reducing-end xylanase